MNNMIFYGDFKNAFLNFLKSDEHDKILFISNGCREKIYNGNHVYTFKQKLGIINYFLRNEQNNFNKVIATIDILMPSNEFETILRKYDIDTDKFIKMFNKYLLMSKINKSCSDEMEIMHTLNKLKFFYGIGNSNLCILKIFEIQALNELKKEKTLN